MNISRHATNWAKLVGAGLTIVFVAVAAWALTVASPSTADSSPRVEAAKSASSKAELPYLVSCDHEAVRSPASFDLTCGSGTYALDRLDWSTWGSRKATAEGRYVEKSCTPNCAEGSLVSYPVTATATAVQAKDGVRFYGRVTLSFTGARPDWAKDEPKPSYEVGAGSGRVLADRSHR
jgi:hypothetical protein